MSKQENLSEGPAEAREEGSAHCKSEAESVERGLAVDHEEDSESHGEDDGDEFEGGCFEAEEEGER